MHVPWVVDDVDAGHGSHGRVANDRVLGDKHEVAHGSKLSAASEAVAVDLRYHGLRELPDLPVAAEQVLRPLPLARVNGPHIRQSTAPLDVVAVVLRLAD